MEKVWIDIIFHLFQIKQNSCKSIQQWLIAHEWKSWESAGTAETVDAGQAKNLREG